MRRIAVVGGGISGITAALELTKIPDLEFELFESSGRLGGVLETLREGDYLVERSADNFATLIPNALELSQEFAPECELIGPAEKNRRALLLHRGRVEPLPIGFSLMQPTRIGSMALTPTLSLMGKLRLLREFFVPPLADSEEESLEDFSCRRLGREVFENLIEPIVGGIFTADPARLSMQAAMPQFVEMERKHGGLIRATLAAQKTDAAKLAKQASGARYEQFRAPAKGMSDWIAQLSEKIPREAVRLQTKIVGLRTEQEGYQLDTLSEGAEKALQSNFDGVILATPAAVASDLLADLAGEASSRIGQIEYASSAVVAVIVDRCEVFGNLDAFGLVVPSKERRHAIAISYTSNKYENRVPADQILFRVFFGGALRPEMMEHTDDQLEQMAFRELYDIVRWTGKAPRFSRVIRWEKAMPQYNLGHLQRVEEARESLAGEHPRIQFCGAGYEGVGIPQCVRSAQQAVRRISATLDATQP